MASTVVVEAPVARNCSAFSRLISRITGREMFGALRRQEDATSPFCKGGLSAEQGIKRPGASMFDKEE